MKWRKQQATASLEIGETPLKQTNKITRMQNTHAHQINRKTKSTQGNKADKTSLLGTLRHFEEKEIRGQSDCKPAVPCPASSILPEINKKSEASCTFINKKWKEQQDLATDQGGVRGCHGAHIHHIRDPRNQVGHSIFFYLLLIPIVNFIL